MHCRYCDYLNGRHFAHCPQRPTADAGEMELWRTGYKDGRAGRSRPRIDAHMAYIMGYHRGEVAREEAQNGHDPRFV